MSMIDVSGKRETLREATATGTIKLKAETIKLIRDGKIAKGDPICTARIAGILGAKKTSALVPLCHPLPLMSVNVEVTIPDRRSVEVVCAVRAKAQTGVEMEALTGASISLLTIWDMVKQYEKDSKGQYPSTRVENLRVLKKVKEKI